MPVMYKNGALQVVQSQTQDPELVFYNCVHSNGRRLPKTSTSVLEDAILVCDWCAKNFPEFTEEDLNVSNISPSTRKEFKEKLEEFISMELRSWENDYD